MSETNGQPVDDFVESVIDSMVDGGVDVDQAVASVLESEDELLPESVQIEESDLDNGIACIKCGNEDVEFGVTETEAGEAPTIYCAECDTALVADLEEGDDEEGLEEAEIDLDNPVCPVCEHESLEVVQVESEDGDIDALACDNCGTGFVPTGEED